MNGAARPSPRILPAAFLFAVAISMSALSGCAGHASRAPLEFRPGEPLAMSPGQRARLPDGGTLDYSGLRSDSRCPPAVACVHAGWVELDVLHRPARGAPTPRVLSTQPGAPAVHVG